MPIRLGDGWRARGPIGKWRLPGDPPFATSRGYELLVRDLRRYVREDIAGRSFLIAGHRGAGKTSTVTQAIRTVRNEVMLGETPRVGKRGRLQRPLLVKLVGESLIAPLPVLEKTEPKAGDTTPGKTAAGAETATPQSSETDEEKPHDNVAAALVHITIALYRALAAEVSEGFGVHALEGRTAGRAERLELAGQLVLELDGGPEPATLRDYWERLGRLDDGVLWPLDATGQLHDSLTFDQGFRELVALSTAAQAYQVCSGAVTYSVTNQDIAGREATLESGADIKDLINRLGAIGAGGIAGGTVAASANASYGIGVGLLVWLLSGATLKWTGKRHRKSSRTLDYSFLRDRSIQSLDRDLPLVIARIRDAGLAPVFVIDELDKIKNQGEIVADIIRRLKHLISDYGFFCFLTNRDYFDEIERKIVIEPYPTEHTYFSERVLVLNRPQDLLDYVVGLATPDSKSDGNARFRLAVFALAVMFRSKLNFTDLSREMDRLTGTDNVLLCSDAELQAVGRFRLEATIQLAINEILSSKEVVERFRSDPGFVQLAIDALYYIPRMWQENSDKDVDISQGKLIEHLVSRRKDREVEAAKKVKAEREAEAAKAAAEEAARQAALPANDPAAAPCPPPEARPDIAEAAEPKATDKADAPPPASGNADAPEEPAETKPAGDDEISSPDQRELVAMVARLADLLSDFPLIAKAIDTAPPDSPGTPAPEIDRARLSRIVVRAPARRSRLIERVGGARSCVFQFRLDELGRPVRRHARPAPARKSGAAQAPAADAPSPIPAVVIEPAAPPPAVASWDAMLTAVSELLALAELSIDDLVGSGALPETINANAFDTVRADVKLALLSPKDKELAARAHDQVIGFKEAFDSFGQRFARTLILLGAAQKDAETPERPAVLLPRIARYLGREQPFRLPKNRQAEGVRISGTAEAIQAFLARYKKWRDTLTDSEINPVDAAARWAAWQKQVAAYVDTLPAEQMAKPNYDDLVMAAKQTAPGRLFRANFGDMHLQDWSQAALAAFPVASGELPHFWLLFASLVALGFGKEPLKRLAAAIAQSGFAVPSQKESTLIQKFVDRAGDRPPAILHVYRDEAADSLARTIPQAGPMLSVAESAFSTYRVGLNWLADNGLFAEGRDDIS